ncbi:MAG TPA: hypothetical protein VMT54_06800 [Candidatus Cybelea sp.]|nr:hypothetical protein [Candidatus Cybelea sp.]
MRASSRRHRGRHAHALLSAALLLQGCVSDATFLRADGSTPDAKQLEADGSACRDLWTLLGGFFVGALYGAASGAYLGAAGGNGDAGEGAIIGSAVGGVGGLLIGAYGSANGEAYDRCMAGKGYHRA